MQREIVADLIIVTVIMNEENDLNFAQCESNKESVDQFSKENKENIVKQVAAWITTNLRGSDIFFNLGEIICHMHPHWISFVMTILEIFTIDTIIRILISELIFSVGGEHT